MKFITITGIDKSGKTSLSHLLWKKFKHKHVIVDRDISTFHFFNLLLDRVKESDKIYFKEYKNKINVYRQLVDLAIILEVNEDDWIKRCSTHDEDPLVGDLSFKDHQAELIRHFNKAKYPNVLKLNTSKLTEDECMSLILKRLGIHKEKINANK